MSDIGIKGRGWLFCLSFLSPSLIGMGLALLASGCAQAPPTLAGGKPVSYWVEALKDPDPKLRKTAVSKLGNIGSSDPAAFPAVCEALKDSDATVRREAILALVKFGAAAGEAIPTLTELQHDPDAQVSEYAGKALRKLERERASSR